MKLSFVVLCFTGFALTFSSTDTNVKYSLLSSDGTYKPGMNWFFLFLPSVSILIKNFTLCVNCLGSYVTMWLGPIIQMKKFLKPSGYKLHQEMIDSLKQYDRALSEGDFSALKSVYTDSAKLVTKVLPHFTNEKISKYMFDAGNECLLMAKRLENGGNLSDVETFEKQMLSNYFQRWKKFISHKFLYIANDILK